MFKCPLYTDERNILLNGLNVDDFKDSYTLLEYLCSEKIHKLGKYLESAFSKRKQSMYIL